MGKRGTLGLIVNPLAGIGGAVGLKGSDGADVQGRARALGGIAAAPGRAAEALRALAGAPLAVVTAAGPMGEDLGRQAGLLLTVAAAGPEVSRGADTTAAAAALAGAGVDLILFAGGDGTARDVLAGAGRVPILGIPGGVKMYSGVFAATPALAGRLAARFVATPPPARRLAEAEVLDIDEESLRRDEPALRLHGTAMVPVSPAVGRAKAGVPADDDADLMALGRSLAASAEPGCLFILGPGRTTRLFAAALSLPKTLLGVDLVRDGRLIARDCSEPQILAALDGGPARILVGLLGQQGCLFGRGNQPISHRVLRRVGRDRIVVLAGSAKVATLPDGLFVDTGDVALDAELAGFIRVHTGPRRVSLLRIRSARDLE